MNDITKSFVNVWIAFKNVIRHFAQNNRNFVVIIISGLFWIIYNITIASNKVIWILALLNAFLCLVNYSKNKNLTEATMTLIIGLFTIFTVTWNNEFILIFTVSILFYVILSFMVSSIQIASKVESIITIAAGYFQSNNDFKTKYNILHSLAKQPTRHHQLSIEERSTIVKEMIFDNIPLEKINLAKELIEGFKIVLGFEINEAIDNYRLLNNFYLVINNKYLDMNDMEYIYNYILKAPLGPREYFDIIKTIKEDIIEKKIKFLEVLMCINEYASLFRDKDIVAKKTKEKLA